jgi:hypothetical protein
VRFPLPAGRSGASASSARAALARSAAGLIATSARPDDLRLAVSHFRPAAPSLRQLIRSF